MKKSTPMLIAFAFFFCPALLNAQDISISGTVTNSSNKEPLHGISVRVKGTGNGITTGKDGSFRLNVPSLPVILEVSFSEFETKEITVRSADGITVGLDPSSVILDAVVMSSDRVERKITSTSTSLERVGRLDIVNSPSDSYWGSLLGKKGLDVTTSSHTYKTFSTRGFNGSGSSRVNQFMDGMDNQAPGLNFSVGNFIGLTELDVESIEILPGASSALYGPGGMNGTILVNSKSPFKYPGLSINIKNGITDIGRFQRSKTGGFFDYSFRWAKNFNDRFAFKIGAQYIQANDWLANDSTNYLRQGSAGKAIPGTRRSDPNYDGVNVYGDETSVDVRQFVGAIAGFYPPGSPQQAAILQLYNSMTNPTKVSRTGYQESNVIDPKTKNLKLSGALHYRFNNNLEGILSGYWATGNTVYTGNNRYVLKGIKMGQYKMELKHKNWFLRGYTTQENAGQAYSATVTSQLFNEAWKPSYNPANPMGSWYIQYAQAYIQSRLSNENDINSHNVARSFADQGRPVAGSAQFKNIFDSVRNVPIPNGGLFLDKSQLWMGEGQYNFSDKIKFAELIVGGNVKKYILNSQGTIFIDTAGALKINEWGAYAQVTKKLFRDKLVLSASGRYDRNENFKGKFTPRVTARINVAEGHNFRLSYQTAYKFPTTQQQWIKLDVGNAILLGGLPWIKDYMNTKSNTTLVYDPATGTTSPYQYKELKPESLRSFEVGYRGLINKKLLIDAYVYFGGYSDFLGRILLIQPPGVVNKPYSIVTNSDTKVKTWGAGFGFDYKLAKNYFLSLNAYTDKLTNVPSGFEAGFNTPTVRLNAGLGNSGLGKKERIGFNVNLHTQNGFYWEGAGFANGDVKAYTTVDAQVNYKFPKIKSMIKLGGTNITNKYYQNAFGNPYIGGLYYVSFAYSVL